MASDRKRAISGYDLSVVANHMSMFSADLLL
jgi:hypothetical protein